MTSAAQSREAVRDALESGKPKDNDGLPVKLVLTIGMLPRPGRHSRVAIVSLEGFLRNVIRRPGLSPGNWKTENPRMRLFLTTIGAATAFVAAGLTTTPSHARFDKTIVAPDYIEDVACRVVRTRIVGPGGRVSFRTRRVCGPAFSPRCRVVKQRTVRPNGSVVIRTMRRCG